ncbi:MAG: Ig-like domain-containing protein, partial [bacterium]
VTISSATLHTSKQSVSLVTQEHNAGKYTITVYGISDLAEPPNVLASDHCTYEVVFDTTRPLLDSLVVKSKDLLELQFSERLDETTAQDKDNYIINPLRNIIDATLDISQQNVLLHTQDHYSGDYQLTIAGVRDIASNTIKLTMKNYNYEEPDRTPPQLSQVILHGLDLLELVFNESLERNSAEETANYSLNNNIIINSANLTGDSLNHVYLSTSEHSPGQTYTITINNITDNSPFFNCIETNTQSQYDCPIVDQSSPRLVSAELQGFNFLILKFSEVLDSSTVSNISNYLINPSLSVNDVSLDIYGKIIYLKTENHQLGGDYTITVQGLRDKAGNEIGSENQQSYSCTSSDNQPPALIRAEALSDASIEVKFNEAVELSSAMNISNYSIDNEIKVKKVRVSNSQQYVYLTTSPHQNGTYTLTVVNIKDLAGNTMSSPNQISYPYQPEDNTPPKITGVEVANEKTIEVIFNEPINPETAENKNNYLINNGISVLSAKLDVRMTSVILQTTTHERGDYVLSVKNITDVHNNVVESNYIWNYSYTPVDNESPYIVSADLENSEKLVITFNEDLDLTTAMNDSNYAINKNIIIKGILPSMSKEVVLETSPHSPGTYTLTVNGIRDASENKNLIHPYSQKEYTWSPVDTTAPSILSAKLNNQSYLELKFSEPLRETEAQDTKNYIITPPIAID